MAGPEAVGNNASAPGRMIGIVDRGKNIKFKMSKSTHCSKIWQNCRLQTQFQPTLPTATSPSPPGPKAVPFEPWLLDPRMSSLMEESKYD